ncbi:MAG: peptidylprolyl isomerase [bacterium]|nr:peptidylprolyl isomerase [bacterium]
MKEEAPEVYMVKLDTSKGVVRIQVTRSWAPRGADRFYNLVKNGFYDEARFFRVVSDFIVQFGMHADPAVSKLWENQQFRDDPVTRTNRKGAITFATSGANTRTTQVFVNLKANAFLDSQGFAPFGRVVEGMDLIESLFSGYGDAAPRAPEQSMIRARGNKYLNSKFPKLDFIKSAAIEE